MHQFHSKIFIVFFLACTGLHVTAWSQQPTAYRPDPQNTRAYDSYPTPKKGTEAFLRYLENEQKVRLRSQDEGIVYISVEVDRNGQLQNPQVIQGLKRKVNRDALRLIRQASPWIPATINGQPVNSHVIIPVHYLSQKERKKRRKRAAQINEVCPPFN